MRRLSICALLTAALAGSLGCAPLIFAEPPPPPPPPPPPGYVVVHADISIFYEELSPHGHWFHHRHHGWVWTPYDVGYGWRPYSHGRWVYTEYGWTWVSYWRWGWAPFHYGRWAYDPEYGWVWIPGHVWAPAWVVWRWGHGWVGWAPVPPHVTWRVGVGFSGGHGPADWDVPPVSWCFVRERWVADSRLRDRLEPAPRNVTLIGSSRIFSNYDEFERHPRNRGPDPDEIEKAVAAPLPRSKVTDTDSPLKADRMFEPGGIRVYRPDIAPASEEPPAVTPKTGQRAVPLPGVEDRKTREMRRIDAYYRRQAEKMEAVHRAQLRARPPNVSKEELKRRQELEKKALEEQKKQKQKIFERRLEKGIVKPTGKAKAETTAKPKNTEKKRKR